MRQFIKRALQKLDDFDKKRSLDFIMTASREIDRLETVMDSLPRGILVCDPAHKLILANKAARRFLSIVSYEQARESVWTVIPDDRIAEFLALTLLSSDKAEEREYNVDVQGIEKILSVSVVPLVQKHLVSGSLILIDDITERKSREARMRRMESLASLTTLAAGIAHEIKNPLSALSIHVQLIQKALAAQEELCHAEFHQDQKKECEPYRYFRQVDKYLKVVNEEVDRLNAIVVDFLFAVRPMNAKLKRGNINAFITDIVEFVSFELKNAGIKIVLKLAENLSGLDFDESLMRQVLLNLINNAAAAMSSGGELTISTEEIEGEVRISVADTGTGISDENLSKIFEPYFTTKESGTGLGLTVVFKIIREHHGEISASSRIGEGSVFTITLPIPQTAQRLITYEAAVPEERVS